MSDRRGPPAFESRRADWLRWPEARERILASLAPGPREEVPLEEALGRALAEPVVATAQLPPWDNSAMDGYAVRGRDVAGASEERPVVLRVTARVRAGELPQDPVEPGGAVRIMTGAPVPAGADSVVRVEHTDAEAVEGRVEVRDDSDRGRNIRPGGEDVRAGEEVLAAGHPVHPGTVGVLAALGRATVPVHRRPSVGILATGEELRPPSRYHEVEAGTGVPESNGPMLAAATAAAGGRPHLLDIAPDDPEVLRRRLLAAGAHDAVVTIGGASMGEADLVKRVLDELGYQSRFWRVRMRPGTPFGFGFLPLDGRQVPVFGLPGNPSSAFVTFELFVRPALLRMAGHSQVLRRTVVARAAVDLPGGGDRAHFLRVRFVEDGRVAPTGSQSSGLVRGLAAAEGLAVVPENEAGIDAGAEVDVLLLDDAPGASPWSRTAGG